MFEFVCHSVRGPKSADLRLRLRCLDETLELEKCDVPARGGDRSGSVIRIFSDFESTLEEFRGHVTFLRLVPGKPNIPGLIAQRWT